MRLRLLLLALICIGCSKTTEKVQQELDSLEDKINTSRQVLAVLDKNISDSKNELESVRINKSIKEGSALYILVLELSNTPISFSLSDHAAAAMNTANIEIAVDKRFYDQVKVGKDLAGQFREGSLLFKGKFGYWNLIVSDKKIVSPESKN